MLFCNFLLINKFLRRMQRVCLSMCVPLVFCFSSFNGILWLYLTFKLKGRFHSLLLIIWNKWTKQRRRRQRQRRRRRRWKIQNPNRISISIICIHFKLTHILDIVVRLAGNRTTYVQVSNGCVCVFCELCVCVLCMSRVMTGNCLIWSNDIQSGPPMSSGLQSNKRQPRKYKNITTKSATKQQQRELRKQHPTKEQIHTNYGHNAFVSCTESPMN